MSTTPVLNRATRSMGVGTDPSDLEDRQVGGTGPAAEEVVRRPRRRRVAAAVRQLDTLVLHGAGDDVEELRVGVGVRVALVAGGGLDQDHDESVGGAEDLAP